MPTGHYMRPGTRVTVPASIIALVPTAREIAPHKGGDASWRAWLGMHMVRTTRVRGRWTAVREEYTESQEEMRLWMGRNAIQSRRNWVVTGSVGETLTLAGWWEWADKLPVGWRGRVAHTRPHHTPPGADDTVSIRRLCVNDRIGILDYSFGGVRWVWVSATNYVPVPDEELAASLGITWADTEGERHPDPGCRRTARDRAHLYLRLMMRLSEWWGGSARAPFPLTAGQAAVGVLRTHVAPRTLMAHKRPDAHRLERQAAFGGRATVWFYGDVGDVRGTGADGQPAPPPSRLGREPGPAVLIDVRSMYPYLLREMTFPTKIVTVERAPPAGEPAALARHYGVVAAVRVRTRVGEYPRRDGERTTYPVGEFDTVLTGPEILNLRSDGGVVHCYEMALYKMGRPFREAAAAMIAMREEARRDGFHAWECFSKLCANAMGGKLAQRFGRWVERRGKVAVQRWGDWQEIDDKTGSVRRYKAVCGLVSERCDDPYPPGPYTAAFAYLTAYGRIHMRRLREACGAGCVFSQDTDGLWCTPAAVDRLRKAGEPFGDTAGTLRLASVVESARFFAPRQYWTSDGWVLAGFSCPAVMPDGITIADHYTPSPIAGVCYGPPAAVTTVSRRSVLSIAPAAGQVDGFGWWHPPFAS